MIDDGLFRRFPKPDVILRQLVMVGPAGTVAGRPRRSRLPPTACRLTVRTRRHDRCRKPHRSGRHGGGDGHALANGRVARGCAAEAAVVIIAALQAGTKENVIPDEAIIMRTSDFRCRRTHAVLAAIERIVNAEAEASGAPRKPEITTLDHYPLNMNDRDASKRVVDAFRKHFGPERVRETGPAPASEDFGSFRTEWHSPSSSGSSAAPIPRSMRTQRGQSAQRASCQPQPKFAPVIHPTLSTGVETLLVATRSGIAVAWSRYARGPPSREEPDRSNAPLGE